MKWLGLSLLVVIAISMVGGCQGSNAPAPVVNNNGTQVGNGLSLNITQPQDESVVRTNPVTISGTASAGSDITVNGLSVSLDGTRFSAILELEPGPNTIEVYARNTAGKQVSRYLTVVYVP
jgi:hypothetical protein